MYINKKITPRSHLTKDYIYIISSKSKTHKKVVGNHPQLTFSFLILESHICHTEVPKTQKSNILQSNTKFEWQGGIKMLSTIKLKNGDRIYYQDNI